LKLFFELPPAERWLLAEAALLAVMIRIGLWLLPFRALLRLVDRLAQLCTRHPSTHFSPDRNGWAIAAVCTYIPAASCLTQALSAKLLLARHGHVARLRIGVAKDAQGQLAAHAWTEAGGQIVVGGAIRERYTALPDF
jgi:hypothetical protein